MNEPPPPPTLVFPQPNLSPLNFIYSFQTYDHRNIIHSRFISPWMDPKLIPPRVPLSNEPDTWASLVNASTTYTLAILRSSISLYTKLTTKLKTDDRSALILLNPGVNCWCFWLGRVGIAQSSSHWSVQLKYYLGNVCSEFLYLHISDLEWI